MRARNLKPEFFRDRLVASLPPFVRWTYQALWIIADDYGTAPLEAEQLKADLFLKWDDISVDQIRAAFALLQQHGRITVHRVPNGDLFAVIVNWKKHQRPNRPSKFRYPTEGEAVNLPAFTVTREDLVYAIRSSAGDAIQSSFPKGTPTGSAARFPKETCDQLYEQWVKLVGAIDYGRFRKAIKPAAPDLTNGLEAIRLFSLHRNTLNERERGFANVERFAQDIARWLRLAAMPNQEEDGTLTERGWFISAT